MNLNNSHKKQWNYVLRREGARDNENVDIENEGCDEAIAHGLNQLIKSRDWIFVRILIP